VLGCVCWGPPGPLARPCVLGPFCPVHGGASCPAGRAVQFSLFVPGGCGRVVDDVCVGSFGRSDGRTKTAVVVRVVRW
jgi:hypothetical protein